MTEIKLGPFNLDDFNFDDFDTLDTGMNIQMQPVQTPDVSNIVTTLKRRAMVVFFIVDISGSMRGTRIGAVNDAIRNVIPELKKREKGNTAAEIKIAVMEFSTKANWRTLSPQPVSTFQYQDIVNVAGGTNYGKAFAALNDKLSDGQFMSAAAGAYTPLIIFMTDGKPSDMGLYKEELLKLKQNKWFRNSTRAGIAIEEGALSSECKRVLMEFTENEKNVYEAKNTVILAKQIELVTLTGVDFVTKQGSIQNTVKTSQNTPKPHSPADEPHYLPSNVLTDAMPVNNDSNTHDTESPTLPIGEIDWENDFNF